MSVKYNKIVTPKLSDIYVSEFIASHLASISDNITVGDKWGDYTTFIFNNKVRFCIKGRGDKYFIEAHKDYTVDSNWTKVAGDMDPYYAMETIVSPNFLYILLSNPIEIDVQIEAIICVKSDSRYYVSAKRLKSYYGSRSDMSTMELQNIDDGARAIYFKNALNIPMQPGSIAYLPNAIISNNGSTCILVKDTLSSTNVAVGSTVSIGSDNYYAIGTNTLVRIDEVIE